MNPTILLNFLIKPKEAYRDLVSNDNGSLLQKADLMFLFYAISRSIEMLTLPESYESKTWEKGLVFVLGTIGAYIISRYVFSFITHKLTSYILNKGTLMQSRFIVAFSLTPVIFFAIISILRVILIYSGLDNLISANIHYYLGIIASIYILYVLTQGIMEIYDATWIQSLMIGSPIILTLIWTYLK